MRTNRGKRRWQWQRKGGLRKISTVLTPTIDETEYGRHHPRRSKRVINRCSSYPPLSDSTSKNTKRTRESQRLRRVSDLSPDVRVDETENSLPSEREELDKTGTSSSDPFEEIFSNNACSDCGIQPRCIAAYQDSRLAHTNEYITKDTKIMNHY